MATKPKIAGIIGAITLVAIPSFIYLANKCKTNNNPPSITEELEQRTSYQLKQDLNLLKQDYDSLDKDYRELLLENSRLNNKNSQLELRLENLDGEFKMYKIDSISRKKYLELAIEKEKTEIEKLNEEKNHLYQKRINIDLENENQTLKMQMEKLPSSLAPLNN